jgi:hypothetical protein
MNRGAFKDASNLHAEGDLRDRPFAPIDNHWSQTMVQCPCCNSGIIESNRVENKHPLDVATVVLEKLKAGKSTHAAGEAALWGVKEIWNRMRAEWKCGHCGAAF